MDNRKNNKGTKGNKGGRPSKAEELQARTQILRAIKLIYNADNDEDAINEHLKRFIETKEGLKFVSEHLLGKAPDKIIHESIENGDVRPMIVFTKNDESKNK